MLMNRKAWTVLGDELEMPMHVASHGIGYGGSKDLSPRSQP